MITRIRSNRRNDWLLARKGRGEARKEERESQVRESASGPRGRRVSATPFSLRKTNIKRSTMAEEAAGEAQLDESITDRKDTKTSKENDRDSWENHCEFMLSAIGYAVGLGNVWRFPYLCYKNGGAAFLIPYIIMLFCAGLPLFFMELALGQYASLGPAILFPKVAPIFVGLGWGMVMMTALFCVYYNIILAWVLFYIFASCTGSLPWATCDGDFNSVECYSQDAAAACRNESLFYYNRTCITVDEYCGLRGLGMYNA
ncbi:sodium- and chloride-dependent GABA transporter 2-like, partial [Penaeus monodon]|uniref:sodium- and chloride-dependent GABA transporter 2-like n=1 Tax=Penaeus monodon TaxID=6687 RepID=UPI0018A718B2